MSTKTTELSDVLLPLSEYLNPKTPQHLHNWGYHLDLGAASPTSPWLWGDGTVLNYDAWGYNQPNADYTDIRAILHLPHMLFNDHKATSSSIICEKHF